MKVSYEGPEDEVGIFGLVFKRGEETAVGDPHAASKLRAHREFDVISDEQATPVETQTEHAPSEADALREMAAHLGIKVDGRWSVKKLQRVIAEAQSEE